MVPSISYEKLKYTLFHSLYHATSQTFFILVQGMKKSAVTKNISGSLPREILTDECGPAQAQDGH